MTNPFLPNAPASPRYARLRAELARAQADRTRFVREAFAVTCARSAEARA